MDSVRVQKVSKKYDSKKILDNVSFNVREGEIFGIIGFNGSGKSTLLGILSTLIIPDSGKIIYFDFDGIKNPERVREIINMVFQEPTLDEDLTIEQNLKINQLLYASTKNEISELIKKLDLEKHSGKTIKKLSGGLKKRAEIARGLLNNPKVLLLDEPTLGLDPLAKRNTWKFILSIRKNFNNKQTIILATNDMEEAKICDRCLFLKEGRIVSLLDKKSFKGIKHFI